MDLIRLGLLGVTIFTCPLLFSGCTKKEKGDEFVKGKGAVPEAALTLTPMQGQYHSSVKLSLDPAYHFNLKAPKVVLKKNGDAVPEAFESVVVLREKDGEVIFPTQPGQLAQNGLCPLVARVFVCDEKESFCERIERELPCL